MATAARKQAASTYESLVNTLAERAHDQSDGRPGPREIRSVVREHVADRAIADDGAIDDREYLVGLIVHGGEPNDKHWNDDLDTDNHHEALFGYACDCVVPDVLDAR